MTSAAIVTLGCGRNEVDSEQLAALLGAAGLDVVAAAEGADVVLVNTCTFIAPAKQESIDTVLAACDLKNEGTRAVVVVGCMAQRYPNELADSIPEADAVVGFAGYPTIGVLIEDILAGRPHDRVVGIDADQPAKIALALPMMVTPGVQPTPLPQRDAAIWLADVPEHQGHDRPAGFAQDELDGPGDSDISGIGFRRSSASLDLVGVEGGGDSDISGIGFRRSSASLDLVGVEGGGDSDISGIGFRRSSASVDLVGVDGGADSDISGISNPSGITFMRRLDTSQGPRSWAYLKLASGCDRVCTFCAIPSFRGRFRSRPTAELVAEAGWLADQGIRELVMVSENTTSWGKDLPGIDGLPGGRALQPLLLDELSDVDGIERLRLMYLQPAELQPRLIEAMAGNDKVASYFDLSLQHASHDVLTRMKRSGSPERFLALVNHIRSLDPDAVFRSNFILGFPGETEQHVQELMGFLEAARLDWVGLFTYSDEDGTAAVDLDGHVDGDEALDRQRRVSEMQERIADAATTSWIGRTVRVLVDRIEDVDGDVEVFGRGDREAPDTDGEVLLVNPNGGPVRAEVGQLVTARITDAEGVDLVAEVLS